MFNNNFMIFDAYNSHAKIIHTGVDYNPNYNTQIHKRSS